MGMFIFTQMSNYFKVLIMDILEKVKQKQKRIAKKKEQQLKEPSKTKTKNQENSVKIYTELTNEEIKYLINLIGKSEFIGKDLQILYSIVAKLQNKLNL